MRLKRITAGHSCSLTLIFSSDYALLAKGDNGFVIVADMILSVVPDCYATAQLPI